MSSLQFYTERAADCRREANVASLVNVRDRCLSAAAAWDNMADRVRRVQTHQVQNAAHKATQLREDAASE